MASGRALFGSIVVLLILSGIASAADGAIRRRISLDGTWKFKASAVGEACPEAGAWAERKIPGVQWAPPEKTAKFLWYRRDLEIPRDWQGKRMFINLRGARYAPRVYVDGTCIGGQVDGWTPLELEITEHAKPGETIRLDIRCGDRRAADLPGSEGIGRTIAPVGGHKNFCGIWLPAYVEAYGPQRLPDADLIIDTSTRQQTIAVSGKVDGEGENLRIEAGVYEGNAEILRFRPVEVKGQEWKVAAGFPGARPWSPETPVLYTLRVRLMADGMLADELDMRFGFKEVWCEGPDIYLNGVKRHILASSTWPVKDCLPRDEIFRRVQMWKDDGLVAFRFHTQPWQEDWLDAADEIGMLTIPEAAVYTDDSGFYAYRHEEFWENYRRHVAGMIRRDRNHASVFMWSLGNEILFMNNQKHDPDLPKKLGDIGRFAKGLDPSHLITYEADHDPDGAYDVIGLHYPHEMPRQHAYPNTANWLGQEKITEAGGGMLGQQRSKFLWDRKKPLYIGEYLWAPHEDYSIGSIWFGDDAYRNRSGYQDKARIAAWVDQTIAYRIAGVSGMCPWTVYDFGGAFRSQEGTDAQRHSYAKVAAYLRNRESRLYCGEKHSMVFDVLNDSTEPDGLTLQLRSGDEILATASLELNPGHTAPLTLDFKAEKAGALAVESVLLATSQEPRRQKHLFNVEARQELRPPEGMKLVMYDPSCTLAGSVGRLDFSALAPEKDILLIAGNALGDRRAMPDWPAIGGIDFDAVGLHGFLKQGGRAVVMEQTTLAPLGLGLDLVDHASTMAFPLAISHPVLKGLRPDDLKLWAGGHYVAEKQVRRPASGGATAIAVTGGINALDQAPVVELPLGQGSILLLQLLVGSKMALDPAAFRVLQNAIDYIATRGGRSESPALLLGASQRFIKGVAALRLKTVTAGKPPAAGLLLADGAALSALAQAELADFIRSGGTLYWHHPDADAFAAAQEAIGASLLKLTKQDASGCLLDRENALLRGVSREDLAWTGKSTGWKRTMAWDGNGSSMRFLPQATGAALALRLKEVEGGSHSAAAYELDRRGRIEFEVASPGAGLYRIAMAASADVKGNLLPVLAVEADGETYGWMTIGNATPEVREAMVELPEGQASISIVFANGPRWGGGSVLKIHDVKLHECRYPPGMDVLATPGALVTWRMGHGRIVLDGSNWDEPGDNARKGLRFANSLMSNLGAAFHPPRPAARMEPIPLSSLKLIGESPWFSSSSAEISCASNATLETDLEVLNDGEYVFRVQGRSTPVKGKYAVIRLEIDGKTLGEKEIAAEKPAAYDFAAVRLAKGLCRLRISYQNDEYSEGEDRNLHLQGLGAMRR